MSSSPGSAHSHTTPSVGQAANHSGNDHKHGNGNESTHKSPDSSQDDSTPDSTVQVPVTEVQVEKLSPHFQVPLTDRFNYASLDCSARVHTAHRSAKSPSSILSSKRDRYMLSPCVSSKESQFVVVELCDDIRIDTVQLANFEFFSGVFKDFSVSVAKTYIGGTGKDGWVPAGTYRGKNIRGVQVCLFGLSLSFLLNGVCSLSILRRLYATSIASFASISIRITVLSTTAPSLSFEFTASLTLKNGNGILGKQRVGTSLRPQNSYRRTLNLPTPYLYHQNQFKQPFRYRSQKKQRSGKTSRQMTKLHPYLCRPRLRTQLSRSDHLSRVSRILLHLLLVPRTLHHPSPTWRTSTQNTTIMTSRTLILRCQRRLS